MVVLWVRGGGRFFHWMTVCVCVCVKEKAERDSGWRQGGGRRGRQREKCQKCRGSMICESFPLWVCENLFAQFEDQQVTLQKLHIASGCEGVLVVLWSASECVCAGRRLQPCETLNSDDCFNMDDLDGWMFPSGNFSQVVVLFLFTFLAAAGFWLHTVLDIKVWDG